MIGTHSPPVLVLGMHRSGTSALTGLLNLLGVQVGHSLILPSPETNPKGFWEHADIVDVHNRLLSALGSSWHDERDLPDRWWTRSDIEPFREELAQILLKDFAGMPTWMVKDPRLCRLLPLWQPLFEKQWGKPNIIMILRRPSEVAQSLASRDGISEERAHLLWLQHMLDAERWTRNYPRALVTFDGLLGDWRSTVDRVASELRLDLPRNDPETQRRVEVFLEPQLRHHRLLKPSCGPAARLADAVYQSCLAVSSSAELESILAPFVSDVKHMVALVSDWSDEIQTLGYTRGEFSFYKRKAEVLDREVGRVKNTVSWRITTPLRVTWNFWKKLWRKGRK
jgi:hypothetical protein